MKLTNLSNQVIFIFLFFFTEDIRIQRETLMHQQLDSPLRESQQVGRISSETQYENDPNIYNSYAEYLFAVIGFAVGFGSFWRFPYLVYKNGGGAFLIPYFIALIFLGIPLLYLQTVVGQFYRCSQPFIFQKINKGLKFLGYTFIIISLASSYYYNLILAYSYRYLLTAFSYHLPYQQESPLDNHYFQQDFLDKSQSIEEVGSLNLPIWILYVVSMIICFYIVKNGVKTSGKIVAFTAIIPYFFFIVLLLRGLFLNGAAEGLTYLFVPKMEKLLTTGIWVDAFVQVFYQISIACGTIINFSSMKKRRQQFLSGVFIMPLSLVICGLLCAMIVFIYLSHFCLQEKISLEDVVISGPQLSFNVFPKALTILPFPNFWIFFFFAAMVFLGIDTQFGFLQTIYCCLKDEYKARGGSLNILGVIWSEEVLKYGTVLIQLIFSPPLASSAGIYYLEFLDYFINSIPLSIGALIEVYIFLYLIPFEELEGQIMKYRNECTPKWIRYLLQSKGLIVMLSLNLLFALIDQLTLITFYPWRFYLFGWFLTAYPYIGALIYYKRYYSSQWNLSFQQIVKNGDESIIKEIQFQQINRQMNTINHQSNYGSIADRCQD